MKHVMLDIETLDTKPSAVILTIGGVRFDPTTGELGEVIHLAIDLDDSIKNGRTISADTLWWWQRQTPAARNEVFEPNQAMPMDTALRYLFNFMTAETEHVWAKGPQFDLTIIDDACRTAGVTTPWHYSSPRDVRTIQHLAGINTPPGVAHQALDDAINQAKTVCECYEELGLVI